MPGCADFDWKTVATAPAARFEVEPGVVVSAETWCEMLTARTIIGPMPDHPLGRAVVVREGEIRLQVPRWITNEECYALGQQRPTSLP